MSIFRRNKQGKTNDVVENASKIFNNTFLSAKASRTSESEIKSFFDSIINVPDAVEYVMEKAPIALTDNQYKNAKDVREYLEKDAQLSSAYDKRRNSLKAEFNVQLNQLKFDNFCKFWKKFNKDHRGSSEVNIADVEKNVGYLKGDFGRAFGEVFFQVSDCCAQIINLFVGSWENIISSNIVLHAGLDKKSQEDILIRAKKIIGTGLSNSIASGTGDDLGAAIIKYVTDEKMTLKKIVKKLNGILGKLASLKVK